MSEIITELDLREGAYGNALDAHNDNHPWFRYVSTSLAGLSYCILLIYCTSFGVVGHIGFSSAFFKMLLVRHFKTMLLVVVPMMLFKVVVEKTVIYFFFKKWPHRINVKSMWWVAYCFFYNFTWGAVFYALSINLRTILLMLGKAI